jgi:hypothetical protein
MSQNPGDFALTRKKEKPKDFAMCVAESKRQVCSRTVHSSTDGEHSAKRPSQFE